MFERIDCVCISTADIDGSIRFYTDLGLRQSWRLDRVTDEGVAWTLVGLDFPAGNSQLTLSTHPDRKAVEVEIRVADVRAAYLALKQRDGVTWIAEPFAIEKGYVAVMKAPDGNVFVLIDS
jgi:catechol 2,3-dioxygenase-like lactoylglutathione lyase family enzyme